MRRLPGRRRRLTGGSALAAGVPAKVVSERPGHASIAITMDLYSHVLLSTDDAAARTVATLILGEQTDPMPRP
jgi:integrase